MTCHLALMLMDDPAVVLDEMRRVLRVGGALHLVVVNPLGFDPEIGRIIRALATAGEGDADARPPRLGDPRTFTADGLNSLLFDGFAQVDIEEAVVARDVPRAELWQFLEDSVYGLDHLDAMTARERLEQLTLPPLLSWRVPLCFVGARVSGAHQWRRPNAQVGLAVPRPI